MNTPMPLSHPRPRSHADLRRIGSHPDFWYPFALSNDLKPGTARGVSFAGEPIVLARTASGKVFALEDRCAHRQMPLCLGVVDGERIQCCYHGWCYNEAGKIVRVPYLPKGARVPEGVRAYPCREAYGLIFAFPGDPAKANRVAFPDIPLWSSAKYHTMYFSRQVNCHYSFMHENLMDMNHQFLHRRLMGRVKAHLLAAEKGDDWVQAQYKFERTGGKQVVGAGLMMGRRDKDEALRHFDVMTVRTQYPYQTLTLRRPTSDDVALDLWTAYVPVDTGQRTNRSFGLLMVKKPRLPGLIHLLSPVMRYFTERVFAEDRMAVEAEQRAYDLQGADWNQEVFPVILDLRQLLTQYGTALNASTSASSSLPLGHVPSPQSAG